jgi:hypothetical protein
VDVDIGRGGGHGVGFRQDARAHGAADSSTHMIPQSKFKCNAEITYRIEIIKKPTKYWQKDQVSWQKYLPSNQAS